MLDNTLLNNQQIMEEIKKEIKICIERNENENMTTQDLWDSVKSSTKREIHSSTDIPQETRKKSNKLSNSTPKAMSKGRNEEPQG